VIVTDRVVVPVTAETAPDVTAVTPDVVPVKVTVVAPAGTVTVAGTETALFPLVKVTTRPDGPAADPRVTLNVMLFPPLRDVGDADRAEITAALTDTLAVLVTAPLDAVTWTVVSASTATDVAVKLAESAPSGTVTTAGTVIAGLLLTKATSTPPAGAMPVSVTLPTVEAPPLSMVAIDTEDNTGAATVMVLVTVVPFADAVVVTTVFVSTTSADTGKVAEVAPSATVTDAGIVKIPLSAVKRTSKPPAGALPLRVTVPTPDRPPVRIVGL
jgi:hypothetical protein